MLLQQGDWRPKTTNKKNYSAISSSSRGNSDSERKEIKNFQFYSHFPEAKCEKLFILLAQNANWVWMIASRARARNYLGRENENIFMLKIQKILCLKIVPSWRVQLKFTVKFSNS